MFFFFIFYIVTALGKPQAVIAEEVANEMEGQEESKEEPRIKITGSRRGSIPRSLSASDGNNTNKITHQHGS